MTMTEEFQGQVLTVEHEPGNGTRYFCVLAEVSMTKWLISWLGNSDNGGTSFLYDLGSYVTVDYIMEKMKLRHEGDAVALMILMHQQTGVSVVIPRGFNSQTARWDGESEQVTLR